MGYGAKRVIYKKEGVKNMAAPTSPVNFAKVEEVPAAPIAETFVPETAADDEKVIPTTFVRKNGPKGDVNKYVKKDEE